ncbi:MarR family winged helix-turn-helix transcriptional regulator [Nitriliruptor alkaliphilus]|uniref:MarR family winged helix-turn-helix transcriptional regulator n=1 Tax=Nitriliruptor alkaliphilus TaxID=427918 RepID=UPI00069727EE|nr:MarR family transcriptional regulator [Nitriliruptor alkaliphilus]
MLDDSLSRPADEPLVPPKQMAAWRAFLTAHARITDRLARELRDREELPLTWYDVLVQLSAAPDHRLRMQELAARVVLSKSGLTRLIDRMEQAGYVDRFPCTDDRRGTFAQMTETGYATIKRTAPTHLAGIREHFADVIDDAEAEVVAAALTRVLAHLGDEPV